jgi:hypothetical protein
MRAETSEESFGPQAWPKIAEPIVSEENATAEDSVLLFRVLLGHPNTSIPPGFITRRIPARRRPASPLFSDSPHHEGHLRLSRILYSSKNHHIPVTNSLIMSPYSVRIRCCGAGV